MDRNIYFNEHPENAPASIILTTLAAQFYEGQASISDTFEGIISKIRNQIHMLYPINPFKLPNPVNPSENLADIWEQKPELYVHFISFVEHLFSNWQKLKKSHSIESEGELMTMMFGEDSYIKAMEAKADTVNKRRGIGLGILPSGIMIDSSTEKKLPVKSNTFYAD